MKTQFLNDFSKVMVSLALPNSVSFEIQQETIGKHKSIIITFEMF